MNYQYLKIHPQLVEYIRAVLVFNHAEITESSELPLFTNGMAALFCRVNAENSKVILYGHGVPDENWSLASGETLIVYLFKPFTLTSIFRISAQALKEKPIDLQFWKPQKAMAVHMQLFYAKDLKEKVHCLDQFLISQVKLQQRDCDRIMYATDRLMQDFEGEVLPQIMEKLGLKERSFQRLFKKYVGVTPTEYRRICQYHAAFSQLRTGEFEKLTDVAYGNGYFDQSHYIHTFREFTEITPQQYLQSGLKKNKT